eukprot:4159398-Alexandrium_andersonii.AAC.1
MPRPLPLTQRCLCVGTDVARASKRHAFAILRSPPAKHGHWRNCERPLGHSKLLEHTGTKAMKY